jgi:hypothetical protein
MLRPFDTYASLFKSWRVTRYEQEVATAPHHTHLSDQDTPEPSTVTNLEDLLHFIQNWFKF